MTIPNGVTSIGDSAFKGCSGLTSVTIPRSVTSIGDWAFSRCSGLTSVAIGNGVTGIGSHAFDDCTNVTDVVVPGRTCGIPFGVVTNLVISDGVTSIGHSAFAGCSGLTSVTILDSVTSIGWFVFSGCSGLTSVTMPNSVTSIGERAFYGCSGLKSVAIPDSVTSIGVSAFLDCSGLTSVTIGNGVTSIGDYAFYGCSGLTSVAIPNSVTSMGSSVFSGCSGLTSVTIGNGVTIVRHADDFVLLAKRWKDGFLRKVEDILEGRMGLTVNREKTKVLDLDAERSSLVFLGYEFRKVRDRLFGTGMRYLHFGPSSKSVRRVCREVHELTHSRNVLLPVETVVERVNRLLKGWGAFYSVGYPYRVFRKVNHYVLKRMARFLNRKSQRCYRLKFADTYYGEMRHYGLYRLAWADVRRTRD